MDEEEQNRLEIKTSYVAGGVLAILAIAVFLFTAGPLAEQQELEIEQPGEDTMIDAEDDTVIATVNGQELTQREVSAVAQNPQIQDEEQAVEQLIDIVLLEQRAEEEGFTATEEEVEELLTAQLSQQGADLEDYKEQLEQAGASYDEVVEQYKSQIAAEKYLEQQAEGIETPEVTDEDVQALYEQLQSQGQELPEFEEVEGQLRQLAEQQGQQQVVQVVVQELRENADIDYQ